MNSLEKIMKISKELEKLIDSGWSQIVKDMNSGKTFEEATESIPTLFKNKRKRKFKSKKQIKSIRNNK